MNQPTPTRTRPSRQADVQPSAPDSVESWLDLLVSMLAIPKQERERVRDELEDHLRSRIDDLLIMGHTEPEALKQAVSELGETADLARQISHAHGPTRKRTYAMHAALFALAGSVAAVGISLSNGGTNPNTVNGVPVLSDVPVIGAAFENEQANEQANEPEARVNLRDTTLEAVIEAATASADRPVLIHWDMLESVGLERDYEINFDVDPLPHHIVHDLLTEHFLNEIGDDTLMLYHSDDLFEISTRSHFDARSSQRRTYDLSKFLSKSASAQSRAPGQQAAGQTSSSRNSVYDIQKAILNHVESSAWSQMGGDRAAMSLVGASLVVTAPERFHEDIAQLLAELGEKHHEREASARNETNRRADRLRSEYHALVEKRFVLGDQLSEIEQRLDRVMMGDADGKSMDELVQEAGDLKAALERIRFQFAEVEERINFLRARLIDAEYASIS